jgi:hypothetical protein
MLTKDAAGVDDLGIGHEHSFAAFFARIYDCKPQHHADLGCGKTDTRHSFHRVDHIGPDGADFIGYGFNG